jgi:hypothetical protein
MSRIFNINLDFAGALASFICALHCMAMPLILSLGVANSSHWLHNHTFDIVIICIGVLIASASLYSDFKKHKSLMPISLVILGFSILSLGITRHDSGHLWLSLLGSMLVISAHYTNWRKARTV